VTYLLACNELPTISCDNEELCDIDSFISMSQLVLPHDIIALELFTCSENEL
jgi:hypothetical protein